MNNKVIAPGEAVSFFFIIEDENMDRSETVNKQL